MVSILVVDDHDIVRAGICKLLAQVSGFKILGEANSGEQAITFIRKTRADVVLMDIKMPGIGGLEATRRIIRLDSEVKIIALTVCDDELFPTRFIQAGAFGYLTKHCSLDELTIAIRKVVSGQRYITPDIAQKLALKKMVDTQGSPFEVLSERELQIMMMITSGQKVSDISEKLHLSPKTVNSYRYRIFDKLEISNDVELTLLSIRHGLLDISHLSEPKYDATGGE